MDSGYNTTSAVSLIDGTNKDCESKEFFSSNMAEDAFQITRHTKVKVLTLHTITRMWIDEFVPLDLIVPKTISYYQH